MPDEVEPSVQGASNAYILARLIYEGALTDWIQPANAPLLADYVPHINNTAVPLDAFGATHSTNSLTVTIGTGEGFVGGAYVGTDQTHDVTLPSNANAASVYVGWKYDATDTIIVGTASAFRSRDPQLELWRFDTDATGVTSAVDVRPLGKQSGLGEITTSAGSEFARWLSTAIAETPVGTAGDTQGEVFRVPGASSDLVFAVETGGESFALTYNAWLDAGTWRSIIGGTPAYRLAFDPDGVQLAAYAPTGQDEAISWKPMTVQANGDVVVNGTTIIDYSGGVVPSGALGGPAGSLSGFPIPPSDVDGSAGSSGDVLYSDGATAYWDSQPTGNWTTIARYEDTDAGTPLDYSYDQAHGGAYINPTYDRYLLEAVYVNHNGSNDNSFSIRVNDDGSSAYTTDAADYTSNDLKQYTGRDRWIYVANTGPNQVGELVAELRGSPAPGADASTRSYPILNVHEKTPDNDNPTTTGGRLRNDHPTVNQIRLWTQREATGALVLSGKNI